MFFLKKKLLVTLKKAFVLFTLSYKEGVSFTSDDVIRHVKITFVYPGPSIVSG